MRFYSQLKIWADYNADAVTDSGELMTLEEAGIASINLTATGGSRPSALFFRR